MTDLATVAANLRSIEDMALRLEDRAIDRSNSRDMPGGDALVNLGGTTPRRWAAHVDEREQAWLDDPYLDDADMPNWSEFEDPDELWPAVQILAWWSEEYRQRLDMKYEGWRPTLVSEAKFLRNHDVAEWIWNNEVHWDDYAGDVSKAKTKLENLLHEGERAERIRVVCPDCDAGRQLIRVYAEGAPDDDRWKCPECRHKFTRDEVDDAYAKQMRSSGVDRWVPINDALSLMRGQGWQERTVLDWFESGDLELSQDSTGRRSVWWPDVWRTHNAARQRREVAAKKAIDLRLRKWICKVEHGGDCWIKRRGCAEMLNRMTAV